MSWYLAVLKNYTGFSGRARRKEYWMFVLFHGLAGFLLYAVGMASSITIVTVSDGDPDLWLMIPYALYVLATFVPALAVTVRRLHDTSRAGWWIFIAFIPFGIGLGLLLYFTIDDSKPYDNKYGPCPKPVPVYYLHPQYPGPYVPSQPSES